MSYLLLTKEQNEILQIVKTFCEKEVVPIGKECDKSGEFPFELYKKAVEMGIHFLDLPERYGGVGLDSITKAAILEELGKADMGFATTIASNNLAFKPLSLAGNKNHIEIYADILNSGGLGAFCLTESQAGSDASALNTTAVKKGNEYIINGSKCFITNGPVADIFLVFALTDKTKGIKGISAFLVEKNRVGISVGKKEDKMGIRSSATSDVIFEDVVIPSDHIIGNEGEGFKLAMKTLDIARGSAFSIAVGLCQAAIDYSVKYAKERVTFGKPIAANQGIQFLLADMEIQTQAARALIYYTAMLEEESKISTLISACAKTFASDTAMKVTTDAVQIFGGYGYSKEYPVEKLMRDAKILQIYEGTNQIQRIVISSQMLK